MGIGAINIAKVCHEVNRAYCKSIGDDSQVPWEEAPAWQQSSAISGVQAILNDPKITPSMLHVCWMSKKQEDGWTYGPVKDVEKKTHPCMVPYEDLSKHQQTKDHLFHAVVHALKEV